MVKAILFNLASKVLDKLLFSIGGRDMVHYEESGEESSEMESVYALKCYISHEVNHLHKGLKHISAIAELM
ncbi:Ubiquitin carboxyl-terminal hydrolase 7 [Camellia lanceoleosa]|uniref:Ubiquitin carboxyl-terminal hydrolase 7 n=1 Tax=Camellia lanceoleosa TaxID=1840588 RepID=A0ACC0HQ37_9ERIC|nr:Ubiquitin carboxyl-terminal hydrolase 7 [Camellia lanceoleosa]